MADPRIRILVEAVTRDAEGKLRSMQRTITDTGAAGSKASRLFDGFKTAIGAMGIVAGGAVAGVVALKKAMEFGKEGAAILQTKASFDGLMDSIGAGPGVLNDLRAASHGTVDDMTLMSATLTLVAGTSKELGAALVENSPQLMEIAKAANKLNPSLGDTAFMYESINRGIKRNSPLILDNLGIVVKVGDANQRWADKMGITVEQMSAEQKQMALLDEVMRSGQLLIEQVGGSTEAMGDAFARAEAEIKNSSDAIKASLAPAIADTTSAIADMIPKVADTSNQLVILADAGIAWVGAALSGRDATAAFNESMLQSVTGMNEAERWAAKYAETLGWEERQLRMTSEAAMEAAERQAVLSYEVNEADTAFNLQIISAAQTAQQTRDLAAAAEEAAAAEAGFKGELDLLHAAISGQIGPAFDDLAAGYAELHTLTGQNTEATSLMTASMAEQSAQFRENTNQVIYNIAEKQILDALEKQLIQDVNESGTAYDEASGALVMLAEKLGLVDEGTVALTASVQKQVQEFISGETSAYGLAGGLSSLSGNMISAAQHGSSLAGAIGEVTNQAGGATWKAGKLKESLTGVAKTWNISLTHNFVPARQRAEEIRRKIDEIKGKHVTIRVTYDKDPQPYQHGGPIRAGTPALVGETGPELFIPAVSGQIIPNYRLETVQHHYNLAIHTSARAESALSDFHTMRALAGV